MSKEWQEDPSVVAGVIVPGELDIPQDTPQWLREFCETLVRGGYGVTAIGVLETKYVITVLRRLGEAPYLVSIDQGEHAGGETVQ
jgi:hypothetical protein